MSLFSLIAKLGLDASGFNSELNKAGNNADKTFSALKGRIAAAFSATAIAAFAKSVVDAGDKIGDMADNFGMTSDQIQEMTASFGKFGIEIDQAAQAMEKLSAAWDEALAGDGKKANILSQLGIDAATLAATKNRDERLRMIGSGLGKFSGEDQSKILAGLSGVKSTRLRGALQDYAAGGGKDEFTMSSSTVAAVSRENDRYEKLWREAKAFVATAAIMLKPASDAMGWFTGTGLVGKLLRGSGSAPSAAPVAGELKTFDSAAADNLEKDKKNREEILKLDKEIAALEFDKLDTAEKRERLIQAIAKLEHERLSALYEGDELTEKKLRVEKMKQEDLLGGLKPEEAKTTSTTVGPEINALQRVGASVADSNSALFIQRTQLTAIQRIEKNTAETVRAVRGGGVGELL